MSLCVLRTCTFHLSFARFGDKEERTTEIELQKHLKEVAAELNVSVLRQDVNGSFQELLIQKYLVHHKVSFEKGILKV
jgi:hypothetical protein